MAIQTFLAQFQSAFEQGALVKCTLSKPTPMAPAGLKNVYLRPVELKKGLQVAFNYRYATRDEAKNYPLPEALVLLRQLLEQSFRNADMLSTERDYSLQISRAGVASLSQRKARQQEPAETAHNHKKQRLIDPGAPWLHELGITGAHGEVLAAAQDKWRQINKYAEIIQSLLQESPLPADARIADMGSGKGYLTFALYDFLRNRLGMNPDVEGIELRQNLVENCNRIAEKSGFSGLHFTTQNISEYSAENLDMLIALHACDTATDLALAAGIRRKARLIVAAPCCHKQIRRDMETHNEMAPLLRHGILEERQAEILTDGIRALLLESEGYQTKVFEFVSSEHTAKNVMITAVKDVKNAQKREKALKQVAALKDGFGIETHFLETLL